MSRASRQGYLSWMRGSVRPFFGIIALGHGLMTPRLIVRFLDDYRNVDRYTNVSRAAAEAVVEAVTGGEKLPDEKKIRAMFKGGSSGDG